MTTPDFASIITRVTDHELHVWAADRWYNPATQENAPTVTALLAQEVQASRKLVADLLALHDQGALYVIDGNGLPVHGCEGCGAPHPCRTRRMIEAATT
jgi:hypothetical protein